MEDTSFYISHPRNGANISRSQTRTLRTWNVPRTLKALSVLKDELEGDRYPSVYILFQSGKKIYVGETDSIFNRLKSHNENPQEGIIKWDKALVINDGRAARFSEFNDTAVRHNLEYYIKNLFLYNGYEVTSGARYQPLTPLQVSVYNYLVEEVNNIFIKSNLIDRLLEREEEREVFIDELSEILTNYHFNIEAIGTYEAIINGEKYFIRPGSKKKKGWQITSRGRKKNSFIDCVIRGEGFLLVNRGRILIIPLQLIKELTQIDINTEKDTIDIFVSFEEEEIYLKYHEKSINVTQYALISER